MATEPEMVTLEEAKEQVRKASEMLGRLHIAFARTIVNEMGEQKGKDLILKAIKAYATLMGQESKEAAFAARLELIPKNMKIHTPSYGLVERVERLTVEGEQRTRAYGCALGKVWRDLGEAELGHLYCYVDPFKSMAFNPEYKNVHEKLLCPDGYCELAIRKTTDQERKDFASEDADLEYLDKHV